MKDVRTLVEQHVGAGRPDLAIECALEIVRTGTHRESHAARRVLAWCAEHLPASAWSAKARRQALDSGISVERAPVEIGEAWFPAVSHKAGRLVKVRVRRVPDSQGEIHCACDSEQRELVETAVRVARMQTGDHGAVEIDFDHANWGGDSCQLAIALATWSTYLGQPLEDGLIATGALGPLGDVRDVGLRSAKLRLLSESRADAKLLVPGNWPGTDPREIPVSTFSAAVSLIEPVDEDDVEAKLASVRELLNQGKLAVAGREALNLLQSAPLEGDEPVEMLAVAMKASTGTANAQMQQQCLEAARGLSNLARRRDAPRLVGSAVVSRIDQLDLSGASDWLETIDPEDLPVSERMHLLGPRAMVRLVQGRLEEAFALREQVVSLAPASERGRCLGDLADAALRLGRVSEADEYSRTAVTEAQGARRRKDYQQTSLPYLRLHRARVLAALGRDEDALATLDAGRPPAGIDPAYRYTLLRAEVLGEASLVEYAVSRLPMPVESVPILAALRWRTLSRLGLVDGIHPAACFADAQSPADVWVRIPY